MVPSRAARAVPVPRVAEREWHMGLGADDRRSRSAAEGPPRRKVPVPSVHRATSVGRRHIAARAKAGRWCSACSACRHAPELVAYGLQELHSTRAPSDERATHQRSSPRPPRHQRSRQSRQQAQTRLSRQMPGPVGP
eukprot:scaffold98044_cov72-Phaeocystis_antarctica.AAC.8